MSFQLLFQNLLSACLVCLEPPPLVIIRVAALLGALLMPILQVIGFLLAVRWVLQETNLQAPVRQVASSRISKQG